MAEGGRETDPLVEHTDDTKEDNDGTFNFNPHKEETSTPKEEFEMRNRLHEQSGLPDTSYQETDFGGTDIDDELQRRLDSLKNTQTKLRNMEEIERVNIDLQDLYLSLEEDKKEMQTVKDFIKKRYPNAKLDTLKIKFSQKNKHYIVVEGPRGGETKIVLDNGSDFSKAFLKLDFVKKALGKPAETLKKEISADIKKRQKELADERKKKEEAEKSLTEQTEKIMDLNDRLNKEKAKISQMKDLPEYDEEIKRKKQDRKSTRLNSSHT